MAIVPIPADDPELGLRERKKLATKEALSWAALTLAMRDGLDNVTVAEIAAEVGVSPRTFNNYFDSKYEAICAIRSARVTRIGADFLARPATEPLWESIAHAVVSRFEAANAIPDAARLSRMREVLTAPRVRGETLKAHEAARSALAEAVAQRVGGEADMYPSVFAGAVIAAAEAAVGRWFDTDPPQPLEPLIRQALRHLETGLRPPPPHAPPRGADMSGVESGTVAVPGAELYYEIRGRGPTVVLVPGGNGDVGPFEGLAAVLADRFRVIAYERRGFARSPLDGEPGTDRIATDVEDLRLLLDQLGAAPAHILGSSSGAIVTLSFLATHPGYVASMVAHEPPYNSILPDGEKRQAELDACYDVFRAEGLDAGMSAFAEAVGLGRQKPRSVVDMPSRLREMFVRVRSNMEFWFEHELRQYPRAVPDVEALAAHRDKLTLGCGAESVDTMPHRPNLVLAERLGLSAVLFPGGHAGYVEKPGEFAEALVPLLDG